jgi:hypothetical protein
MMAEAGRDALPTCLLLDLHLPHKPKPILFLFILQTKKYADLIIPRGPFNDGEFERPGVQASPRLLCPSVCALDSHPGIPLPAVAVELIVKYLQEQLADSDHRPLPDHPNLLEQPPIPR